MAVYNFGSINWDHVFTVPHLVRTGETLSSLGYQVFLGGKGANQSVALAKAGADVHHIGALKQSDPALEHLTSLGVCTSGIEQLDIATGQAMIQVMPDGDNAIVLSPGANHRNHLSWLERQLANAESDDWLLLQNETNLIEAAANKGQQHSMKVAFNPAPMDKDKVHRLLSLLDLLIINQIELTDLTGTEDLENALQQLHHQAPSLAILVTLGSRGALYQSTTERVSTQGFRVQAVDTTGAGDTFIGYFIAALDNGLTPSTALSQASAAAAISVTQHGAMDAIPNADEVHYFMDNY
ncbi:Ribokinase [Saliniradius amylolyticus]|uniref:Ribokinase n=1 Tax=Saliniradius amylolyticus TaxID=2183582 RepID=A0A2S2DZG9_9ALTE|nr:ribokinase [Saliniradius amylolyticus]AWL10749.1 Ribokinase [Saliniradius amylolyticus]